MTTKEKYTDYLTKFIKLNNLEEPLKGSGSSLNSACTAIAGFSLYLNLKLLKELLKLSPIDITDIIRNNFTTSNLFPKEFANVYYTATIRDYEEWWTDEDNRSYYDLSFIEELNQEK